MPANLALVDLVLPYVGRAQNLGVNHPALAAVRVLEYEMFSDDGGTVIRGRCEMLAKIRTFDPIGGRLVVDTDEGDPPRDPTRLDPIFDLGETTIEFELIVPRQPAASVFSAATKPAALQTLFSAWGAAEDPVDLFTLDLVLNAPSLRLPSLAPAQLNDIGTLTPIAGEVRLLLPRLRFRLVHAGDPNPQLSFLLVAASGGLDDPATLGSVETVRMEPNYAFITQGEAGDHLIGIGFDTAIVDFDQGATPPAILGKFGFGDDWTGLYVPLARLFITPEGTRDFAVAAGVTDLLIGLGNSKGVSGDFDAAVIQQGSGAPTLSARFIDASGKTFAITRTGADTATADLPAGPLTLAVDVSGGRAPYKVTLSANGAQPPEEGRLFFIDLTNADAALTIGVSDSSGQPIPQALMKIAARRIAPIPTLPVPKPAPTAAGDATVGPTQSGADGIGAEIVILNQANGDLKLATKPPRPDLMWRTGAGAFTTQPSLTYPASIKPGETIHVEARIAAVPALPEQRLDYYFHFNEPPVFSGKGSEADFYRAYGLAPGNVETGKATSADRSQGRDAGSRGAPLAYLGRVLAATGTVRVLGEASIEGDPFKVVYNKSLAQRRALTVQQILLASRPGLPLDESDPPKTYDSAQPFETRWPLHGEPTRRDWWKATAILPGVAGQPERSGGADITRPAATAPKPTPTENKAAPPPPRLDWFRSIRVRARIADNVPIAIQIDAEVDFATALEQKFTPPPGAGMPPMRRLKDGKVQPIPSGGSEQPPNPSDGIVQAQLVAQRDPTTGKVLVSIRIGADPADKDGLLLIGSPLDQISTDKDDGLTLAGAFVTFWPLFAGLADGSDGGIVSPAVAGSVAAVGVVAQAEWFRVERMILYGGEFTQRVQGDVLGSYLLFDVRVDWSIDIAVGGVSLITIPPETPLSVRYKAIGLGLGNENDAPFALRPVFDSSKGYTIDIAQGGVVKVLKPFDKLLRILAARISKTNPTAVEFDLGVAVDLGVVSIERARIRAWLDQAKAPELTAFSASVDLKGVVVGSGFLELDEGGFAGGMDVTIVPLSIRASGSLGLSRDGDTTSLFVGLAVVLPIGLPLGATGLGIYGFRGIFGMHYRRHEFGGAQPALTWLENAKGKPEMIRLDGPDGAKNTGTVLWEPASDAWSFGLGLLVGTMDGGILVNLDGMVLLELPGPRLLITMVARLMSPPPSAEKLGMSGGVLAVIEIAPDHIQIGILVEYSLSPLVSLRIPVDAFFPQDGAANGKTAEDWYIHVGSREIPIEVDVLGLVRGTGYLQLEGNGLAPYRGLSPVTGFAIGVGAAVSQKFGGSKLYLRVGGSIDAVMGFDAFLMQGIMQMSGELRLFILTLGADCKLDVMVREVAGDGEGKGGNLHTYIKGEVCGRVKLLFYTLKGCVNIELGDKKDPLPPPPLIKRLSLKNRSPALAEGSAAGSPVDGVLASGIEGAQPLATVDMIAVPIDAIPMLTMACAPNPPGGGALAITPVMALNGAWGPPGDGFVPRGSEHYRYVLTDLQLTCVEQPATPFLFPKGVTPTPPPATWCATAGPKNGNGEMVLSLLSWEPTAASKAITYSHQLKKTLAERWSRLCTPSAPATSVRHTFLHETIGPSTKGWDVDGVAWPDPPGSYRSVPPDLTLMVTEPWRARPDAETAAVMPALVLPALVPCAKASDGIKPGPTKPWDVLTPIGPIRPVGPLKPIDTIPFRRAIGGGSATRGRKPLTPGAASAAALFAGQIASLKSGAAWTGGALLPPSAGDLEMFGAALGRRAKTCAIRLLQSPVNDDGRTLKAGVAVKAGAAGQVAALGDMVAGKRRKPVRELYDFGLLDRVLVHTEAVSSATILLFVYARLLEGGLVVRQLDGTGKEIGRIVCTPAMVVKQLSDLPPTWVDPDGPWVVETLELMQWGTGGRSGRLFQPILIRIADAPEDMAAVEIGIDGSKGYGTGAWPPYYIAAVERLTQAEGHRAQWDESQLDEEQGIVTKVLDDGTSVDALLQPGCTYGITTKWSALRRHDPADASGDEDPLNTASGNQTFWFRTDAEPPSRLDPWIMATLPAEGEAHLLRGEPLRIIFNTADVDRLYAAYGYTLVVRLQASTAHHPAAGGDIAVDMHPIDPSVWSPFEQALRELVDDGKACIDVKGSGTSQGMAEIQVPLDPYTDYLLDVVATGPAGDLPEPVLRRHFSTGTYAAIADLALAVAEVPTLHRAVAVGTMAAFQANSAKPDAEGDPFEEALRIAGLLSEPAAIPRVTLIWEPGAGGAARAAAILIESIEPLWRSRPAPLTVGDPADPNDPVRTVMTPAPWLVPEQRSGASGITAILGDAGGSRAMVMLAPDASVIGVDLVRKPLANWDKPEDLVAEPLFDMTIGVAPWEEEA